MWVISTCKQDEGWLSQSQSSPWDRDSGRTDFQLGIYHLPVDGIKHE